MTIWPQIVLEKEKYQFAQIASSAVKRWLLYVCAKSCLTLSDPMDCSPPGSSVHGVLQARILEWVAISSSRGSSWPRNWTRVSYVSWCQSQMETWLLSLGYLAQEAVGPLAPPQHGGDGCCCRSVPKSCLTGRHPMDCSMPGSMGFSRQEYGSGLLFFLQGIFPTQGSNVGLLHWQVDSLPLITKEAWVPSSKQPKSHHRSARKETPGFPNTLRASRGLQQTNHRDLLN